MTITKSPITDAVERLKADLQPFAERSYGSLRIDMTDVKTILTLISDREEARAEIEELEAFWPKWALDIKAQLEGYGVEFDDDEVDLPAALSDWIGDFEASCVADLATAERIQAEQAETISELVGAVEQACDLLAERTYGNAARSPGHNARLVLEAALLLRLSNKADHRLERGDG